MSTILKVPDSPENWTAFGGQCSSGTRNGSAYPMVRLVAVMALRSHLQPAVYFSDYATGEAALSDGFWSELPDNSVTIADRNFLVADDLTQLERSGTNRHWLTRAKSTTRLRVIKQLRRRTRSSRSPSLTRRQGHTPDLPPRLDGACDYYPAKGFRPSTLPHVAARRGSDVQRMNSWRSITSWGSELGQAKSRRTAAGPATGVHRRTPAGDPPGAQGIALAATSIRLGDGARR